MKVINHGSLPNCRSSNGFTLIKLLVVIAIISIPAAMLLPALTRAKLKATQAAWVDPLPLYHGNVSTATFVAGADRLQPRRSSV